MDKRVLITLGLFLFVMGPVTGEPRIQRYFHDYSDYQFILKREITQPRRGVPTFSAEELKESLLESFSVWDVLLKERPLFSLQVYQSPDTIGAFFLFNRFAKGNPLLRPLGLKTSNLYSDSEAGFWRGPFFFRVLPEANSLTQKQFRQFVEKSTEAISIQSLPPLSVAYLPEKGRQANSVGFYLGPETLSENVSFPDPLLGQIGFEDRVEVAYGRYDEEDLFIIGYPTPAIAARYFIRFQDELKNFFTREGLYLKRTGPLLALFRGPEDRAVSLLEGIKYHARVDWIYEKDKSGENRAKLVTFFGLVTTAILGAGAFIVMSLIGGVMVGLIRYELLRRYPVLTSRKESIRLNLDR